MKKAIYLMVLTLLLAGGAIAQMKSNKQSVQPMTEVGDVPAEPPVKFEYNGTESGAAVIDVMNANLLRGNSFVMISNDRLGTATSMTVSLDFYPVEDQPGVYIVTGGSWSMTVYEQGKYVGALFGDIPEGVVTDVIDEGSGDCLNRSVKAMFRVTGGMERYENVQPEDKPSGDFSSFTDYADRKRTTGLFSGVL